MSTKKIDIPQPFQENFKVNAHQFLKHSAYEDLREEIVKTFSITPEQLESLFPKKKKGYSDRLSNGLYLYGVDADEPLFFRINIDFGKKSKPTKKNAEVGMLVPTLYALWRLPTLLPPIYTNLPIVPKITGPKATAFYMPGLWIPELPDTFYKSPRPTYTHLFDMNNTIDSSTSDNSSLPPPQEAFPPHMSNKSFQFTFNQYELRAVFVVGQQHAVGVCLTTTQLTVPDIVDATIRNTGSNYMLPFPCKSYSSQWPPSYYHSASQTHISNEQGDDNADIPLNTQNTGISGSNDPHAISLADALKKHPSVLTQVNKTLLEINKEQPEASLNVTSNDIKIPSNKNNQLAPLEQPDFEFYPLQAYINSPFDNRPLPKGEVGVMLHSINDTLCGHGNTNKYLPKTGFIVNNNQITMIKAFDTHYSTWKNTLSALRTVWYNCVADHSHSDVDADEDNCELNDLENISVDETIDVGEGNRDVEVTEEKCATTTTTEPVVFSEEAHTLRFEWAIQFAIKTKLTKNNQPLSELFPLSMSELVDKYIRHCSRCPSILDYSKGERDQFAPLNIKSTKFKKFPAFLKHCSNKGWLTHKNQQGNPVITSVNASKILTSFPFNAKDERAFKNSVSNQFTSTQEESEDDGNSANMQVIESYRVTANLSQFLENCSQFKNSEVDASQSGEIDNMTRVLEHYRVRNFLKHRVADMGTISSTIQQYIRDHKLTIVETEADIESESESEIESESESESEKEKNVRNNDLSIDDLLDKPPASLAQDDDGYDSLDDFEPNTSTILKQSTKRKVGNKKHGNSANKNTSKNQTTKTDKGSNINTKGKPANAKKYPIVYLNPDGHLMRALNINIKTPSNTDKRPKGVSKNAHLPLLNTLATIISRSVTKVYATTTPTVETIHNNLNNKTNHVINELLPSINESGDITLQTIQTIDNLKWNHNVTLPVVYIIVTAIKGKTITLMLGFERYGIDVDRMVKTSGMKEYLACSITTVNIDEEPGLKNLIPVSIEAKVHTAVYCQGNQEVRGSEFITEHLNINEQYVHIYRKTKRIR